MHRLKWGRQKRRTGHAGNEERRYAGTQLSKNQDTGGDMHISIVFFSKVRAEFHGGLFELLVFFLKGATCWGLLRGQRCTRRG